MLTWTTYGTWLQGDERGYVKDGRILAGSEGLALVNRQLQLQGEVCLSKAQRQAVREAILKEATVQGHNVYAISVQATHIHIVLGRTAEAIEKVVAHYKTAGRLALKGIGCTGKVWTRGYDKRFCFDQACLRRRIEYVQSQNPA